MQKHLIVIVGPTGIGKTKTAIKIAQHYNTEIISADSRQIFKELKIGTAAPTQEELNTVIHHNIATRSITDYYSAWEFEKDALEISSNLFKTHDQLLLTGGSMMYIDAICKGIDDIPTIDKELRDELQNQYITQGIDYFRRQLKQLDPEFYQQVDLQNHKRVIHAVEICLMTGKPYSSLRTNTIKKRPFHIIKAGLELDRADVYNRINLRVDKMVQMGLIDEAREFYTHKELNSLNTVGYKEIFAHFDGEYDINKAIELIKRNTRRYAKKQLTWFKKDQETLWFKPDNISEIISYIDSKIINCPT
ncbi:tRNA (adenosine(37)-N6)-dimethylallyltransferase MiaA [Plebeiibacterium marinum]|uniref:tRNA dimethylallyltransferase n=1 Tax=Plebeiibacterium marinum TaxID=2992111 RepID=A0AAE3MHH4_9BACT|nr:tRNA (adenosine(37)-N6)-dimethylallyltransferase MiaA [Plebeiobacterium marinum]MCW3807829.1 tRNA (adenosine(37)-N6)-dimethylallyltransferase MiaA [Plebeiobacterium marinum]